MKLLEDLILQKGKVINESILKVDSFLNHQIDPMLMNAIGEEFYNYFHKHNITKIITIEASGIACAVMAGFHFKTPVVFAKKQKPSTFSDHFYKRMVTSFTKNVDYEVCVSKEYLHPSDRVLIIDDFLAHGNALKALCEIVLESGAQIVGAGIVIEKSFQQGRNNLNDLNLHIHSLAMIDSLKGNKVTFKYNK
jgi:xanthine phosphoribosyltransferase